MSEQRLVTVLDWVNSIAVLALMLMAYANTTTWPPRFLIIGAYLVISCCQGYVVGGLRIRLRDEAES